MATRPKLKAPTSLLMLPLLMAGLSTVIGCSAGPSRVIDGWTGEQGGVLSDARQERVERTLARLSVSSLYAPRLSVAVLNTGTVGAFCWPSGQVFVTRGLVDLVNDDELCAAIAHEAGHLVVDGHLSPSRTSAAALDGCRRASCEDSEIAADRAAHGLLRSSTVSEQALPRLLNKLIEHGGASSACRGQLARRIAQLTATATRAD